MHNASGSELKSDNLCAKFDEAVAAQDEDIVKEILEINCSAAALTMAFLEAQFLRALTFRNSNTARLLASHGVNPNCGFNAIVRKGDRKMLHLLIELGGAIETVDELGLFPNGALIQTTEWGCVQEIPFVDELREVGWRRTIDAEGRVHFNSGRKPWGMDLIPPQDTTLPDFFLPATRFRGTGNPEEVTAPFYIEALRCDLDPDLLRQKRPGLPSPLWTGSRYGQTATELPDGGVVLIGGEYEDSYHEDFLIFSDVIAHDCKGGVRVFFYSPYVFPPTDFHTATLGEDCIWLIGRLGYGPDRQARRTPVYRLSLSDFSISKIECKGRSPGWIHGHEARLRESKIIVSGGLIDTGTRLRKNNATFELDLGNMNWTKVR